MANMNIADMYKDLCKSLVDEDISVAVDYAVTVEELSLLLQIQALRDRPPTQVVAKDRVKGRSTDGKSPSTQCIGCGDIYTKPWPLKCTRCGVNL